MIIPPLGNDWIEQKVAPKKCIFHALFLILRKNRKRYASKQYNTGPIIFQFPFQRALNQPNRYGGSAQLGSTKGAQYKRVPQSSCGQIQGPGKALPRER